jgi:hypothetical protein
MIAQEISDRKVYKAQSERTPSLPVKAASGTIGILFLPCFFNEQSYYVKYKPEKQQMYQYDHAVYQ